MTTCDEARPALIDLVFGELDERSKEDVQRHLTTCSACAREEARLIAMHDAVRGPAWMPSAALEAQVAAELAAARKPAVAGWRAHRVPAIAAAAFVAMAVIVAALPHWRTGNRSGGPHPAPPVGSIGGGLPFTIAGSHDTGVAAAETKPDSTPPRHSGDSL